MNSEGHHSNYFQCSLKSGLDAAKFDSVLLNKSYNSKYPITTIFSEFALRRTKSATFSKVNCFVLTRFFIFSGNATFDFSLIVTTV
jgi:hypothetical protein